MKWFLLFALMTITICQAHQEMEVEPRENLRILELLPNCVHPPLVTPYLPEHFVLGKREEDPHFTQGYFWGDQKSLDRYFGEKQALSGCLIHAQVSSSVFQIGVDRFSCDQDTNKIITAGLTEVKMSRGKWGIFPYRTLQAKGPKGRRHYHLWIGLNSKEKKTLYFQFIYPDFLKEPTQSQKKIWENFLHKTTLLDVENLLIAHGIEERREKIAREEASERIEIRVEKRRWDQKFLIRIASPPQKERRQEEMKVEIQSIKEVDFLTSKRCGKPYLHLEALIYKKGKEKRVQTIDAFYTLVDQFSFDIACLFHNRFEERGKALLLHTSRYFTTKKPNKEVSVCVEKS